MLKKFLIEIFCCIITNLMFLRGQFSWRFAIVAWFVHNDMLWTTWPIYNFEHQFNDVTYHYWTLLRKRSSYFITMRNVITFISYVENYLINLIFWNLILLPPILFNEQWQEFHNSKILNHWILIFKINDCRIFSI